MEKVFKLLLLLVAFSFTSCLKMGLEDLPEFEDADISSVTGVYYRYFSAESSPGTGLPLVKEVALDYSGDVNKEARTVKITAASNSKFPSTELHNLDKSKLVVVVSLSTAARIQPTGGSPALGTPGDWSKPNTYIVTAADKSTKEWTIEVTELTK